MFFPEPLNVPFHHMGLLSVIWRSPCSLASPCYPGWARIHCPLRNPWLSELVYVPQAVSEPCTLSAAGQDWTHLAGKRWWWVCFHCSGLWLSSPRKPRRLKWGPGDTDYRPLEIPLYALQIICLIQIFVHLASWASSLTSLCTMTSSANGDFNNVSL